MAKFLCVCGYTIRMSGDIPNPVELLVLRDETFESLYAAEAMVDDVYRAAMHAYRCPQSGHLWVFWNGLDSEATLYAPTPIERTL